MKSNRQIDGRVEAVSKPWIRAVFEPLEKEGIETEMIQIGGTNFHGCLACGRCAEMQNGTCVITKDPVRQW